MSKNGKAKPRSREKKRQIRFIVDIETYGTREKARLETAKFLGNALYDAFGNTYKIYDGSTGAEVVFDHLAHDGEHPGHSDVIKFKPLEEQNT